MKLEDLETNSLIVIGAVAFTFLLILFFMLLEGRKKNMNSSYIISFIDKYPLASGIILIIVALAFWAPILGGSENMFWYKLQYWWSGGTLTVLNSAYINSTSLLLAFMGSLAMVVGIKVINTNVIRGAKKLAGGINRWRTKPK